MQRRAALIPPQLFSQETVVSFLVEVSSQTYKADQKDTHSPLKKIDFDDPAMTESDYRVFTGIEKSQFNELLQHLPLRSTETWSDRNSLGLLLTRIKTGDWRSLSAPKSKAEWAEAWPSHIQHSRMGLAGAGQEGWVAKSFYLILTFFRVVHYSALLLVRL